MGKKLKLMKQILIPIAALAAAGGVAAAGKETLHRARIAAHNAKVAEVPLSFHNPSYVGPEIV